MHHHSSRISTSLLVVLMLIYSLSVTRAYVCPPDADISPCFCGGISYQNQTDTLLYIGCSDRNLNDAMASQIIENLLANPDIDPVRELNFYNNSLTKVPAKLPLLSALETVNLRKNIIGKIQTGAFNFTKPMRHLDISENSISAIESNAFLGNYSRDSQLGGSQIRLTDNNITRLDADVFKNVLEQQDASCDLTNSCGALTVIDNNPIDCKSDPCHLAWLVRDNRHLLASISGGKCSDGTELKNLDPETICQGNGSNLLTGSHLLLKCILLILLSKEKLYDLIH